MTWICPSCCWFNKERKCQKPNNLNRFYEKHGIITECEGYVKTEEQKTADDQILVIEQFKNLVELERTANLILEKIDVILNNSIEIEEEAKIVRARKAAEEVREFTLRKKYRISFVAELNFNAFDNAHARNIWDAIDLGALRSEESHFNSFGVGIKSSFTRLAHFNQINDNGSRSPITLDNSQYKKEL